MGAHKGHFRIICAVCVRLVQPGKEGSETIIGVCDDCRTQSQIEAKRHHDVFNHESPRTVKRAYRVDQSRRHVDYPDTCSAYVATEAGRAMPDSCNSLAIAKRTRGEA